MLLADYMSLYIQKSQIVNQKSVKLIKNFSKLEDIKFTCRNQLCFYTLKIKQKKTHKTIPFTLASTTIKYLEINVAKEVKDLYNKTLEDFAEGYERRHKQMKRSMFMDWKNIDKMFTPLKAIYKFNAIPIKVPKTL